MAVTPATARKRLYAYIRMETDKVCGDYDADPEHLAKATGAVEFAQVAEIIAPKTAKALHGFITSKNVLSQRMNGGKS